MNSKSRCLVGVVLTVLLVAGCSNRTGTSNPTAREDAAAASALQQGGKQSPQQALGENARIILLHHSTGQCIWDGGVEAWFDAYNQANRTQYRISEQAFPKDDPYGWNNYPYDYWNIWVRHAGVEPYQDEPTLEILTPDYDVIVFKHCFPVSNIEPDTGSGDAASEEKRLENYQRQYTALKEKLRSFPGTRFIVWTAAAQVGTETDQSQAQRAKSFVDWVRNAWDQPGDNIYVWDFYALETEGGLYLKPEYSQGDGHPNEIFSQQVAPLLAQRIVDTIEGSGDGGDITGKGGRSAPAATNNSRRVDDSPVLDSTSPTANDRHGKAPPPAVNPESETFVFDNAEDPQRNVLWPQAAEYVADADGHRIKVDFAEGQQEDWGEYGLQRIVVSNPQPEDWDVSGYGYVAFRIRADRDMDLNFTLVTEGDRTDESYFGFTAYPQVKADQWKWIVLDLATLELGAEGEQAYAAAGEPQRPMRFTQLKLVTHEKNAQAEVSIDDITFYQTLPKSLTDKVHVP